MNLLQEVENLKNNGYTELNAIARLCQDIVLAAISACDFTQRVTVKGGVVMRNLSKNARRATQDLDLDFLHYPLTDKAIYNFVKRLNCLTGITLSIAAPLEELNHQDYKGKRVHLVIQDNYGASFESKLDIGVHRDFDVRQNEFCFDICFREDCASLLMNSPEQVFVEKLKSLLRFGAGSTRYKDIYDLYYLIDFIHSPNVEGLLDKYVYRDSTHPVNTLSEVYTRIKSLYSNSRFTKRLATSKKNWLGVENDIVFTRTLEFISSLH